MSCESCLLIIPPHFEPSHAVSCTPAASHEGGSHSTLFSFLGHHEGNLQWFNTTCLINLTTLSSRKVSSTAPVVFTRTACPLQFLVIRCRKTAPVRFFTYFPLDLPRCACRWTTPFSSSGITCLLPTKLRCIHVWDSSVDACTLRHTSGVSRSSLAQRGFLEIQAGGAKSPSSARFQCCRQVSRVRTSSQHG